MNLDLLCEHTFAHQRELLDAADQRRQATAPTLPADGGGGGVIRHRLSSGLRRLADWLEPVPDHPRVGLLRAVAHHEIDVEQAMMLLRRHGHSSARS